MKLPENLEKLLPLGYLFLVVLGIFKETIFYYPFNINILKYSSIMDILISPIATITESPIVLGAVIVLILISFAFFKFLSTQNQKKWVQKMSGIQNRDQMDQEALTNHFLSFITVFLTVSLFSFFIGTGFGQRKKLQQRISQNKLKFESKLNYNSGESEQVYLISSNSLYYFYIKKGEEFIKIAPIGAIKNIQLKSN
ncbi:hypothetical protein GKZ90_0025205 [Flavobacterium sp. MC2016-06]|uniref:hypothetical protein n=1 Tax=Flavobacterium sp. MC2016-06 TaxID=2676308 RepID=UPI0012BB140F|nr:hypothetical protein [Flavobacterium sp. MC2016-06]MBU3862391.1 hypothetical protein [Flavobacterium sp. MC2016-06]